MIHDILTDPNVVSAIHVLILALATALGSAVAVSANQLLKANLSARDLSLLAQAAQTAVLFAEQTGLGKTGEEKLAVALKAADEFLSAHGIPVTAEELRAAIEAAVFQHLK